MEKKNTFKCIIDNLEKEFEVLYTFKSIKTNKDLLRYVKENYNTEFSSSIFTVYRTRIKK